MTGNPRRDVFARGAKPAKHGKRRPDKIHEPCIVTAGKSPDQPENHKRQNRQPGTFMDVHAPHIHADDTDNHRHGKTPVEQSQRKVPDKQTFILWRTHG